MGFAFTKSESDALDLFMEGEGRSQGYAQEMTSQATSRILSVISGLTGRNDKILMQTLMRVVQQLLGSAADMIKRLHQMEQLIGIQDKNFLILKNGLLASERLRKPSSYMIGSGGDLTQRLCKHTRMGDFCEQCDTELVQTLTAKLTDGKINRGSTIITV